MLLKARHLTKVYQTNKGLLRAVTDVTFNLSSGETLGIVGESGSGKSTLGRLLLRLEALTSGEIEFENDAPRFRQMIFQNPYGCLNPKMRVGDSVAEGMDLYGFPDCRARIDILLELVGLERELQFRYPHELSGGQLQRIGIARALALEPQFIVCDEPIASLDVRRQAQIVELLKSLQQKLGTAYLFISHDLARVQSIAHHVAVMYLGHIVELTSTAELFAHPRHPYTQALLAAIPSADPFVERNKKKLVLVGEIPSPLEEQRGCPFASRCPHVTSLCREQKPSLLGTDHKVACHIVAS